MRKLLRINNLVLNVIILVLFFFGQFIDGYFIFDGFLNYVPFIIFSFINLLNIIEFVKYDGIGKLVFYYFSYLFIILMFINDINMFNNTILLFSVIAFFVNLVSVIRINKIRNKTFNSGIYSYKQKYLTSGYIVLTIYIIAFIMLFCETISFILIFALFLILTIIYVVIFVRNDCVRNALITLAKSLDFNQFNSSLISLYKLPLHKDSYSMINLYRTNYLFLYDKNKAYELFNNTSRPKNKRFSFYYDLVLYTSYFNNQQFDKCYELLSNLKLKNKRNKIITNTEKILKIYTTNDILDVENIFNEQIYLIDKLIIANDLIYYYLKHDDKDKALYYAYFIKNNKTDLALLYENADIAIKKYEKDN